jgi:hypothetical protein
MAPQALTPAALTLSTASSTACDAPTIVKRRAHLRTPSGPASVSTRAFRRRRQESCKARTAGAAYPPGTGRHHSPAALERCTALQQTLHRSSDRVDQQASVGSQIDQKLLCVLAAQYGVPPRLPGLTTRGLSAPLALKRPHRTDLPSLRHFHPTGCTLACMPTTQFLGHSRKGRCGVGIWSMLASRRSGSLRDGSCAACATEPVAEARLRDACCPTRRASLEVRRPG